MRALAFALSTALVAQVPAPAPVLAPVCLKSIKVNPASNFSPTLCI